MELKQSPGGTITATRYYGTVATRTSAGLTWLAADHHNSTHTAIDAATLTVTTRRMMPYGETRGSPPAWPTDKAFVGGTNDPTGLTHLGAREYDPTIGRFLSVDPVMDLTDPQQWHGYAYANNNPTTQTDPDGLIRFDPTKDGGRDEATVARQAESDAAASKLDKARTRQQEQQQRLANAAGALADLLMEELGITAALTCFSTGDIGACGETAVNVLTSVVGGAVGKLVARYAFQWKRAADVARALWRLGGEIVSSLKGWFNARQELRAAQDLFNSACKNSFTAATPVLLADGTTKPIDDVDIGDTVTATDPDTNETTAQPVTRLITGHGEKDLVDLAITTATGTHTITATTNHPIWQPATATWTNAGDLKPGDPLHTSNGTPATIITTNHYKQATTVYNLTVANTHTYYVLAGDTPVLVHNCGDYVGKHRNDDVSVNGEYKGKHHRSDEVARHRGPTVIDKAMARTLPHGTVARESADRAVRWGDKGAQWGSSLGSLFGLAEEGALLFRIMGTILGGAVGWYKGKH